MTLTDDALPRGQYGAPPLDLAAPDIGALQFSPLSPSAHALEAQADASLGGMTMLAPPGAAERRYALAQALRVLAPGAPLIVLAAKDRGGSRLRKELEGFGCMVDETARRHHRICHVARPETLDGVDRAIAADGPQQAAALGMWSQPGVFSWDRPDPGSALLAANLPKLAGEGADLGCGVGYLARAALASPGVRRLTLIDVDRRAVEAARRNIDDPRAEILWADARAADLSDLDFVVMNPPFHDAGHEDRSLGQVFIQRAAQVLHNGGVLWMVANRHLPYEAVLGAAFRHVTAKADSAGYKVFEARK